MAKFPEQITGRGYTIRKFRREDKGVLRAVLHPTDRSTNDVFKTFDSVKAQVEIRKAEGIRGFLWRKRVTVANGGIYADTRTYEHVWGFKSPRALKRGVDAMMQRYHNLPEEVQGEGFSLNNLRQEIVFSYAGNKSKNRPGLSAMAKTPESDLRIIICAADGLKGVFGKKKIERSLREVTYVWGLNSVRSLRRGASKLVAAAAKR